MGKKSRSGSEIWIRDEHPDHISESLETIFWAKITSFLLFGSGSGIRNFFYPGSGMEKFGSGINIPDLQH
jgi:hypothetical protein